jgi:hypothetical protein
MRGGWPLILGSEEKPFIYHVYSRKHGDLERDYNAFYLAAELYSQGNGNYRDVNQNRRCDVLFNPQVKDFNVLSFLELIQIDGYNPLVVNGSRFTILPENQADLLALTDDAAKLKPLLARPFTPGSLLKAVADQHIKLKVTPEAFIKTALTHAEQHFEATFGEGYWIDHWFYTLDLIDTYLAVYPDQKDALLFDTTLPYFDSPEIHFGGRGQSPPIRRYSGGRRERHIDRRPRYCAQPAADGPRSRRRLPGDGLCQTAHAGAHQIRHARSVGDGHRNGSGQAGMVRRAQRPAGAVRLIALRDL